jgi:hypothetical protein
MTEYSATNLIFQTAKITAVGIGFIAIAKLGYDREVAQDKVKQLLKELNNAEIENKNLRNR